MNDIILKYPFKDGLNHEFEILDIGKVFQEKKDLMVIPHRAQFYHIIWIEKGEGKHFIDFNSIDVEDNTILFIPHNSVNMFDRNGVYGGKAILFTKDFFCKNSDDLKYLQTSMLFSDLYKSATIKINSKVSDLRILLNTMETEFLRQSDNAQYNILHNMLHVFLLQAERELRKQGFQEHKQCPYLDSVVSFKELLENKYRKEKSVNKYASDLHISEKQLHKATKLILDKTPKEVINDRVLLEAKRLLAHSSESVKGIAYDLGYDEPTNFIKYFRKHLGSTPSEFREQF